MTGPGERAVGGPGPLPSLSLVIPAFNESARLAAGLGRLHHAVHSGALDARSCEFVLVDDGSTDDTSARATDLLADLPHVQVVRLPVNHGKGAAVRAGVAAAGAPLIAFGDADMAIDPAQVPLFVDALERNDLAIGSRAAAGAAVDKASIRRSASNRAFNLWVNAVTRLSLADTQCGFKAFRAPAAKLLFHCTVTERFAFDVELLVLARRLGLTIAEVPVRWSRVEGSRITLRRDAIPMARDVLRAARLASAAPPVPALRLKVPAGGDGPRMENYAARLPVLAEPDGTELVLCPLMDDDAVSSLATALHTDHPDAMVEATTVTAASLCDRAPLRLPWSATG
ncbi:MAG TPA: glycosyltransferase [Acidimicrobiales bacterium]|nr:glycosyltransferase [Acidimicrobiales bacterium]